MKEKEQENYLLNEKLKEKEAYYVEKLKEKEALISTK